MTVSALFPFSTEEQKSTSIIDAIDIVPPQDTRVKGGNLCGRISRDGRLFRLVGLDRFYVSAGRAPMIPDKTGAAVAARRDEWHGCSPPNFHGVPNGDDVRRGDAMLHSAGRFDVGGPKPDRQRLLRNFLQWRLPIRYGSRSARRRHTQTRTFRFGQVSAVRPYDSRLDRYDATGWRTLHDSRTRSCSLQ